jgi:hypothetical protein
MDTEKIICKIYNIPKIFVKINDSPKIVVKFGEQGLKGDGTNDHALLSHLDYENAGHIGFQKQLVYSPDFKAYEVE